MSDEVKLDVLRGGGEPRPGAREHANSLVVHNRPWSLFINKLGGKHDYTTQTSQI